MNFQTIENQTKTKSQKKTDGENTLLIKEKRQELR